MHYPNHTIFVFEYRPEYLYVFVKGEYDLYAISRQYWQEVADACKENGVKKVLVEEDIAELVSMSVMFRLVSELGQIGLTGIKVAFVDRQLDHASLNELGILVGINRGLIGKAFSNQRDAVEWLMSSRKTQAPCLRMSVTLARTNVRAMENVKRTMENAGS